MKSMASSRHFTIGLALASAFAVFGAGCASRYDLKLWDGGVVTAHSRPKINEFGQYEFKDVKGQWVKISSGRVQEIERR